MKNFGQFINEKERYIIIVDAHPRRDRKILDLIKDIKNAEASMGGVGRNSERWIFVDNVSGDDIKKALSKYDDSVVKSITKV